MSNGLTSVLLDVLVIAGNDLATSAWEKRFVYWLAQHDQSRNGLGCVGFDIEEMGWTRGAFDTQQRFVLGVIDSALARYGWDRIPFEPREESVFDSLKRLRELVVELSSEQLGSPPDDAWVPAELPPGGRCEVHRVYLHETGCIICNDAPIDLPREAAPNRSPGTE
jgi:hypothetical protein